MPLFAQIPVDGLADAPKGVLHNIPVTPGERRGVHMVGGDVDCRVEILFIGRFRRIGEDRDHTVANGFRKQVAGDMRGEVAVDDVSADPLGQGCGEACVLPGVVLGDSGELLVALFRVGDDAADDFIDADFGEGDTGVVPGVVGRTGSVRTLDGWSMVLAVGVLEEAGAPGEVAAQLGVVHIAVCGVLPAEDSMPCARVTVVGDARALQVEVECASEGDVAEGVVGADAAHVAQACRQLGSSRPWPCAGQCARNRLAGGVHRHIDQRGHVVIPVARVRERLR